MWGCFCLTYFKHVADMSAVSFYLEFISIKIIGHYSLMMHEVYTVVGWEQSVTTSGIDFSATFLMVLE